MEKHRKTLKNTGKCQCKCVYTDLEVLDMDDVCEHLSPLKPLRKNHICACVRVQSFTSNVHVMFIMIMLSICAYLNFLKKPGICPCKCVLASGDTRHLLAFGRHIEHMTSQDGSRMAAKWFKMLQDGPRWPNMAPR